MSSGAMQGNAPSLLGVVGSRKRSQRPNFLVEITEKIVAKNSIFKEPKCSLYVLVRLILFNSEEKSSMEVWTAIRELFPYYRRCAQFTLKSIKQVLKTSKDVSVRIVDDRRRSFLERERFMLRGEVSFSYNIEEIIGEGRTIEEVTNSSDELHACLKRERTAAGFLFNRSMTFTTLGSNSIKFIPQEGVPIIYPRVKLPPSTSLILAAKYIPSPDGEILSFRAIPIPTPISSSSSSQSSPSTEFLAPNPSVHECQKNKEQLSHHQSLQKEFSMHRTNNDPTPNDVGPNPLTSFSKQYNEEDICLSKSETRKNIIVLPDKELMPSDTRLYPLETINTPTKQIDSKNLKHADSSNLSNLVEDSSLNNPIQHKADEVLIHNSSPEREIYIPPEAEINKILDTVETDLEISDLKLFNEGIQNIKKGKMDCEVSDSSDSLDIDKKYILNKNPIKVPLSPIKDNVFKSLKSLSLKSFHKDEHHNKNKLPLNNIETEKKLMDLGEIEIKPTNLLPESKAVEVAGKICPDDFKLTELEISYVKEEKPTLDSTGSILERKDHESTVPNKLQNSKRKISIEIHENIKSMCLDKNEHNELVTSSTLPRKETMCLDKNEHNKLVTSSTLPTNDTMCLDKNEHNKLVTSLALLTKETMCLDKNEHNKLVTSSTFPTNDTMCLDKNEHNKLVTSSTLPTNDTICLDMNEHKLVTSSTLPTKETVRLDKNEHNKLVTISTLHSEETMCLDKNEHNKFFNSSHLPTKETSAFSEGQSSSNANPKDGRISNLEEIFHRLKCKFEWIKFHPEKGIFSCSTCNNQELLPGLHDSAEVEFFLNDHDVSEIHILYPFLLQPRLVYILYKFFKYNFSLPSVLHFKKDILSLLSKNLFRRNAEVASSYLFKLFEKYTTSKIISNILNSSLPFSVIFNYCKQTAILKTADKFGMPFECVLIIKNLKDWSPTGILNSINLNINRVIFFKIWPTCQNCNHCTNRQSTLVENPNVNLTTIIPRIYELSRCICEDDYIVPYFSFVSALKNLYSIRPSRFYIINEIRVLGTKSWWKLSEFIYKNFLALRRVCQQIFKEDGDISALGLILHQINFDDKLMLTLKMVNKCIEYAKRIYENTAEDIYRKQVPHLEGELKREIEEAPMHCRIKGHLLNFLNETSPDSYFAGSENTINVNNLCSSTYLRSLNQLSPVEKNIFLNAFKIFERFLKINSEVAIKELNSFGYHLPLNSYLTPQQILSSFRNNQKLSEDFAMVQKFYCLLSLIPITPTSSESIKCNFGEVSPFVKPLSFYGLPTTEFKSIHEYLKEQIHLLNPS